MLSSESITLAVHQPTGKILHIDQALNGLACECICLQCEERLEAIQGKKRRKHFRHYSNTNCGGGLETALHQLAKQILMESRGISLPLYGKIIYQNPISEKSFKEIVPDVSVELIDGTQVFFEVYHKHKIESKKELFFRTGQHKSIEIDMKNCPVESYREIQDFVINQTTNKRIIFWELPSNPSSKNTEGSHVVTKLIAYLTIFLIAFRMMFPRQFKSIWKGIFS